MANKDDEQVLVIKSDIIFSPRSGTPFAGKDGRWQGLKTDNLDYYIDLIKNNCEFKRRGDVENDTSYQQIIPYIVFNYQDKYFIYNYLDNVAEKRLVNNYQIGVGGHINKEDVEGDKDIIEVGTMREWNEEVNFGGNILEKKLIGIIKDDSRPVEQAHIGLVYNFVGDNQEISVRETDKIVGELVNLNDIGRYIEGNPGVWVKIVYNEYLKKLIK